jgi:uncharacterized protein (TIGR00369 family)
VSLPEEDNVAGTQATVNLTERVLARMGVRPFVDHLGCELIDATPGRAQVRLPWRPPYSRSGVAPGGIPSLHGGAAAALADITASYALMTLLAEGEMRTTIDLSIQYLAPVYGDAVAEAFVRRRGKRTAFIDIEIRDGQGEVAALARATFAILPPSPA